uniref:Uncharacterized protein n=1 Tax=Leersia perrieri TaxID=77586 RepID=A0A0D9WHV9_9ORYZ
MHFHLTSVHPHPCEPRHASPSTLPLYRCHLRTDAARYLPPSPSVFAVLPSHRPLHIGVSVGRLWLCARTCENYARPPQLQDVFGSCRHHNHGRVGMGRWLERPAPLIIGYNVRHISQETYDIQANMEVIAINQVTTWLT